MCGFRYRSTTVTGAREYFVGRDPARQEDPCPILVFDLTARDVVYFERYPAEPVKNQIGQLREISRTYNRAVVRAFDAPTKRCFTR
ncbi:MAG: hypothetical protein WBW25_01565 [Halobacteriota archaeon]|jgi:hypothetical protein